MFFLTDEGWFFEDEEGYTHGPFENRDTAQIAYRQFLKRTSYGCAN
jgi:hypothetical protein